MEGTSPSTINVECRKVGKLDLSDSWMSGDRVQPGGSLLHLGLLIERCS